MSETKHSITVLLWEGYQLVYVDGVRYPVPGSICNRGVETIAKLFQKVGVEVTTIGIEDCREMSPKIRFHEATDSYLGPKNLSVVMGLIQKTKEEKINKRKKQIEEELAKLNTELRGLE